jgi:biopolymer transport protein ExbB
MDHIRRLGELLVEEIARSGEVRLIQEGPFISRDGREASGELLLLGNFTAFYRRAGETGFLLFSDKSRRFFSLSRLPEKHWQKKVQAYMDGRSEDVLIDISRGAALRQYTQRPRLAEQLRRGGPIVWPIVFIGLLALVIILERIVSLQRKSVDSDRFMARLIELVSEGQWAEARRLCARYPRKALPRVLQAGIDFHGAPREDLENGLQEAILSEIPTIERFLSTLGMLAAIAPLLGLLGTVTGMINTFQAITFFGTGNPRVMSGGISEALITTMLGLAVAIPIMLAHSLLSRKVEKLIGDLEARAVSFVNQVCKGGQTRA